RRDHRRHPARAGPGERDGLRRPVGRRGDAQDRRRSQPGDRARPGADDQPAGPPLTRPGTDKSAGFRLIGPYSTLLSSSRVTWSPPDCSGARQFPPTQLSASPWLPKASFGTSPELAGVPSVFSNRQDQTMSAAPPRPSLAEPPQALERAAAVPLSGPSLPR